MTLLIEPLQPADWPTVREIYREGLATGLAAFALSPPDWPRWDSGHLGTGRLVARAPGGVVGWAALAPVADT